MLRNVATNMCVVSAGDRNGDIFMRDCTNESISWHWKRNTFGTDVTFLQHRVFEPTKDSQCVVGYREGDETRLGSCLYIVLENARQFEQVDFDRPYYDGVPAAGYQVKMPNYFQADTKLCLSAASNVTLQSCNSNDHNQLWVPQAVN